MARSSGAGVTLLVLVSMAIPDLVCGGQERGKDSRLTHTHFTPHQYYTPQTGGVKSMTFHTPPRNEMLEENQYSVKSSESGNKPDAAIPNSDQPQAERSRGNECNDVKCSDYGSDGASPNGVELNRVAWDKVSDNTQISTEDPMELTHSEGLMDLTHSEGPMELTHSEGPMELTHSEGPMELTHSKGPVNLTHSESPMELTHSKGPVNLKHSEGPMELTHSEDPMELTHSEGPMELTHSEGPAELTHSVDPVELTHSEDPADLTHSEGPMELTHSKGPVKLTHSEDPMELTHSEGPMELTHSEGPAELTHSVDPVELTHSEDPTELTYSEGPAELVHSEGPVVFTHSEGPADLTHSEDPADLTHSEGPMELTHSKGPVKLTHSEGPVDFTHSEGPADLTHSEDPADLTHSEGPVVFTHSEGPVDFTHSEGPADLTHSKGPVKLTHSEGPVDFTHSEGPADLTHSEGPVVLTHSGAVRGLTLDEAHVFYGIPYAAPPVGPKRWAAPEPVSQWVKPYDATFPRPACMQECAREFSDACLHEVSEDCLYLNLYVPLSVDLSLRVAARLPVMVWIHGGDFIAGSASKPLYDGRSISNYSDTLVVNMQYRLGAFGFLVTGSDPERAAVGNYGILDQQVALRWVRENIAAFGGDPTKVTLFAESAGAQSVCLHLMMWSSESLFRHATIQSQPFSIPLKSRWDAMMLGRNFVKQTNCSASDLQCLRLLSTHTVLQAQVQAGSKLINPFRFLEMFETWGPHVDGELITEQPIAAFQQGRWQSYKPVIVGTTSEEGVSFVYGSFNSTVSALEFVLYITAIFKQHTLQVLQKYLPVYREQDRWTMLSQIVTDFMFLCPARRVARSARQMGGDAWVYVFDHAPSDHKIWEGLTCCYRHACHGAELPFLFDSAPAANFSFTARETLLANQMVCYWGAFAHSGDPNSHGEHTPFCRNQRLAPWPKYTPAERWPVLNLTLQSHLQHQNRDGFCDFWDRLDIY